MEKVNRYSRNGVMYDMELWYDVSNQVFYDVNDSVFGVGIIRGGVAYLRD